MQPTRARWPITMSQDGGRVGTTHSGTPIRYIRLEQHADSSSLWFYNEDGDSFGTVEAKRASERGFQRPPYWRAGGTELATGGERRKTPGASCASSRRESCRGWHFLLFLRRYSDRRALVATVRTHRPSQGGAEVKGRERAAPPDGPDSGPHGSTPRDASRGGRIMITPEPGAAARARVIGSLTGEAPSAPPRCREPRRDRS
jgi:hypothetical protein